MRVLVTEKLSEAGLELLRERFRVDVREDLTGPLVDAMYDDDQVVRKTLSNGVTFEFLYAPDTEAPEKMHIWISRTGAR